MPFDVWEASPKRPEFHVVAHAVKPLEQAAHGRRQALERHL
jgi:hypothetical protein